MQDQRTMAAFLRDPGNNPPPAGVEQRRLKIYQDLVYNNIEGFISGGFPVLRSLYGDDDWHAMVRTFIEGHRCHTPYFLEISQEFLAYLEQRHQARDCDPPFLLELARYEWVELALDVSTDVLPPARGADLASLPDCVVELSPLAWPLQFEYPVHLVGPSFQPGETHSPTFLVVYRGRDDAVKFMEINAATARLLQLIAEGKGDSVGQTLSQLALEMGMEQGQVLEFGSAQVAELVDKSVLLVTGEPLG